ncbi:MAG: hypothetical protein MUO33_09885, partial [Sedimentisphaerales bacterium]|nr:hypothetical protein [Sedimentisphaerales bacterium]
MILSERYLPTAEIENFQLSIFNLAFLDNVESHQDSQVLKAGVANNYGGISLTLNNQTSYFNIFVSSISIQVDVTQNISVLVYDLIS